MTNEYLDIFTRPHHALGDTMWNAAGRCTRYECSIESNPAPAIVCSLRDLRYVMVNQRFLAFTDSSDSDWLRRSMYERDLLEGVVNYDQVKRALVAAQTIPQTRASLAMPDGTSRRVIVTGEPVTVAGQPCMLFTLTDIEAWRQTELCHDQYRTSVEAAFATSSACMMIADAADNVVSMANESLCSLIGYSAEELAGRLIEDIDIWPYADDDHHESAAPVGIPIVALVAMASSSLQAAPQMPLAAGTHTQLRLVKAAASKCGCRRFRVGESAFSYRHLYIDDDRGSCPCIESWLKKRARGIGLAPHCEGDAYER